MAQNRERQLVLQAIVEEQSARRGELRVAALREEFERAVRAAKQLSLANNELSVSLEQISRSGGADQRIAALTSRVANIRGLGQSTLADARVISGEAQAARASMQLRAAAQDLAPAILQTTNALQGPGGMGAALAGLTPSIASVGAAGLIAAPAIVALGIAINKFIERINDGKQGLQDALDAQRLYAEAVTSGTRESIQAQLDELETRKQAREIERGLLQEQLDGLTLLQRAAGGGQLKKQLEDTNDTIRETDNAIVRLQEAMTNENVIRREEIDVVQQAAEAYLAGKISLDQFRAAQESQLSSIQRAENQARNEEKSRSEESARLFLAGRISLDQYRNAQEKQLSVTQRAEQKARDLEQARERTVEVTQKAIEVERERSDALREANLERRKAQQDSRRLIQEAEAERTTALQDIVQKAQGAAEKAARALTASIERIRDQLAFNVSELGLDRRFTDIAAARRQAAFDIATTRRDARLDDIERNIDLQRTLEEERVRQEKRINDLVAQRTEIEQRALANILTVVRQTLNNLVYSSGGNSSSGGAGLSVAQQRQVRGMIGAGLESLTR